MKKVINKIILWIISIIVGFYAFTGITLKHIGYYCIGTAEHEFKKVNIALYKQPTHYLVFGRVFELTNLVVEYVEPIKETVESPETKGKLIVFVADKNIKKGEVVYATNYIVLDKP